APRQRRPGRGYHTGGVDPAGMCCGAAGIYSLIYPDTAAELGSRKATEVQATGSTLVASANPGCEMQLRQHLPAFYRVAHPVEIYHEALVESESRPRVRG